MVQTVVVVVLILADVLLIQLNLGILQGPVPFVVPGTPGFVATPMLLLVAVGVTLVLGWLAGQADRAILERQVRHRDATLRVMSEELLRLRMTMHEQQPSLEDIRTRLDTLDREVRILQERAHEHRVTAAG
ncbi:MAG TPA: hypothetical protein VEP50_00940 [bacterium]|nr:hypothetical protein [bacterium]